jgi:hypothetical protein
MIKGDISNGTKSPAGPYREQVDYGGNDMPPCGARGCVLSAEATHLGKARRDWTPSRLGCLSNLIHSEGHEGP